MSSNIGKKERETQDRVVQLFVQQLDYTYLGYWENESRTQPIEEKRLLAYLIQKGYSKKIAQKAVDELVKTATQLPNGL